MEKETITIDKDEYDQLINTKKSYQQMIENEIARLQREMIKCQLDMSMDRMFYLQQGVIKNA